MINITDDFYCYGCGICADSCPKGVFEMNLSKDGFYIPNVVNDRCIECGICDNVCAFNSEDIAQRSNVLNSYSVYSNDSSIRRTSTSGGLGFELSKAMIENGYKVLGVEYDYNENIAKYSIASDVDHLYRFQGSKYIQANPNRVFKYVLSKNAKNDKFVVFGTPCYIDSARRAVSLLKREDSFVFIDFFCHGVPSYLLWDKYLNKQLRNNSIVKPNKIVFRDKIEGWGYDFTLSIADNERTILSKASKGDLFHSFFLKNLCLNKACYQDCKYKYLSSSADIRIGDLWSSKFVNDKKGISGAIVLTEKGSIILDSLKSTCTVQSETLEIVTEGQLKSKLIIPEVRNSVIRELRSRRSLSLISNKYILPIKCKLFYLRAVNKLKRIIGLKK